MSFDKYLKNITTILSKNKLLVFFIIIAVFLRLYRLEEFATFLGDQGRDAIIVKRILTFEHWPAIGPPMSIGQIYLGPFFYYLISPFLLLFNFNPVGLASGSVFISVVGLIILFIIVKKCINVKAAFISLFLGVFSWTLISFSRSSWNPNLLPFFSFFTLYAFYKLIRTDKKIWALVMGAFLSFSLQLHYLMLFLVPLLAVTALGVIYNLNNDKRLELIKKFAFSFGAFLFFYSPLIIFDLRHQFLNSKNFIKLFNTQDVVSQSSILNRFVETNQYFFSHVFQTPINSILAVGIYLLILFLFMKNRLFKHNLFLHIHFIAFLGFIPLFSLLNSLRYPHYYGAIYLSFFVIITYFFSQLFKKKLIAITMVIILSFLYLYMNAKQYNHFYMHGGNQVKQARLLAQSISDIQIQSPYQLTSIPQSGSNGHVRYFLEIMGKKPLPEDSTIQPSELFILCYDKECIPLESSIWQVAIFKTNKNAKIEKNWEMFGVKIYKLIHEK